MSGFDDSHAKGKTPYRRMNTPKNVNKLSSPGAEFRRRNKIFEEVEEFIDKFVDDFLPEAYNAVEKIIEMTVDKAGKPLLKSQKRDLLMSLREDVQAKKNRLESFVIKQDELIEIDTISDLGKMYQNAMLAYSKFNDYWHQTYDSLSPYLKDAPQSANQPQVHSNPDIQKGIQLIRALKGTNLNDLELLDLVKIVNQIKEYRKSHAAYEDVSNAKEMHEIFGNLDMYLDRILLKIKSKIISKIQTCDTPSLTAIKVCRENIELEIQKYSKINDPDVRSLIDKYFGNILQKLDEKQKRIADSIKLSGYDINLLDDDIIDWVYYYQRHLTAMKHKSTKKPLFTDKQINHILYWFYMIYFLDYNIKKETKSDEEAREHAQTEVDSIYRNVIPVIKGSDTADLYINELERRYNTIKDESAVVAPPSASTTDPLSASAVMHPPPSTHVNSLAGFPDANSLFLPNLSNVDPLATSALATTKNNAMEMGGGKSRKRGQNKTKKRRGQKKSKKQQRK